MTNPTSNLNTILERLKAIQLTIPGIVASYAYQPADPSSADVPFFVNAPSKGRHPSDLIAQQLLRITDRFDMALCVARLESDSTLAAVLQNFYGWRDLAYSTFAQHVCLSITPGQKDLTFVIDSYITSWEEQSLRYGTADFAAFVFELQVRETQFLTVSP